MGDDSGIGGHCLIFGHNSFLSKFEGYPVDFEPIEIGKSVSSGLGGIRPAQNKDWRWRRHRSAVRCTRMIPPRCLAIGFPARIVSKAPEFPRELSEKDKLDLFRDIVTEMIKFFVGSGLSCEQNGGLLPNHESI